VYQRNSLKEVSAFINRYKNNMETYAALYRLSEAYGIPVKKEDIDNFTEGITMQSNLTSTIISVESNMEKNLQHFKRELM
jgi:hypothetical protein